MIGKIDITKRSNPAKFVPDHKHDYYEIYFLNSGKVLYHVDDTSFSVSPRSVVVISPGRAHQTISDEFERYLIVIYPSMLTEYQLAVLKQAEQLNSYRLSTYGFSLIETCLKQMDAISPYDANFNDKAYGIFSYIIFLIDWDMKMQTPIQTSQTHLPLNVYRIVQYLEQNFEKSFL